MSTELIVTISMILVLWLFSGTGVGGGVVGDGVRHGLGSHSPFVQPRSLSKEHCSHFLEDGLHLYRGGHVVHIESLHLYHVYDIILYSKKK